jgi:hypothetical protein
MDDMQPRPSIRELKIQAKIELDKLQAQASAKDVAGKAIGRQGLFYITLIVVLGVGASVVLENEKIAAVMGLLGASLTALISMLNGIAGTAPKQEKPEFKIIETLIERISEREQPMNVDVGPDGRVTVSKGSDHSVLRPTQRGSDIKAGGTD